MSARATSSANANKTRPQKADVAAHLQTLPPPRRADAQALLPIFARATQCPARLWSGGIVGYGRYCYRTGSGRRGEFFASGFAARARALVAYILPGYQDLSHYLARLGPHKTGKCCLYFGKLSDIDAGVLEEIVSRGMADMRARHRILPD